MYLAFDSSQKKLESQNFRMSASHERGQYSKLLIKQVIFEIQLPECHPTSRAKIVSQLAKRQLKQFQSDTLQVYVLTNPPRLSLLAMPKSQDRIYLFADDLNVADACAHQFYADALARLQTLEPNARLVNSPGEDASAPPEPVVRAPYKVISLVARADAAPPGTQSVVDLMDLESRILSKHDASTFAIFEPEEYPALIWLDVSDSENVSFESSTEFGLDVSADVRTLVFPSGAIVVHGPDIDRMEKSLKSKLPLIQKCMTSVPESISSLFQSYSSSP
jgi:hypothetical protein